jgi:carboxyl-terminal processing protease
LATILDVLKQKIDFTADESIVDDPDLLDYPADAQEARERWRKQVKYELLTKKILKVDEAEAVDQLRIRYRDLNRYFHQFDTTDLLERYLTSLTMAVDPHSSYMGAKTLEDLMGQQLHLSLEGIGASLSIEDGFPIVKEIVPGGAADKDGRIEPEDKIVGVETDDGKVVDFVEKKLSDVVRIIRGPRGTKIRLIVQPSGSKERKVYELTREKIELKDAHAKGQVIETKGADGKPLKVGVIDLPSFYGDTAAVRRRTAARSSMGSRSRGSTAS